MVLSSVPTSTFISCHPSSCKRRLSPLRTVLTDLCMNLSVSSFTGHLHCRGWNPLVLLTLRFLLSQTCPAGARSVPLCCLPASCLQMLRAPACQSRRTSNEKFLVLRKSNLSFLLYGFDLYIPRYLCLHPSHTAFSPMFVSKNCVVFIFIFESMKCLKLRYVIRVSRGLSALLSLGTPRFSRTMC